MLKIVVVNFNCPNAIRPALLTMDDYISEECDSALLLQLSFAHRFWKVALLSSLLGTIMFPTMT